jgi:predicted ATPase
MTEIQTPMDKEQQLLLSRQARTSASSDRSQQLMRLRIKDGGFLEGVFKINDISIGNLDVTASRDILSDLLSTDESQLHELAQVCHEKTQGNAFFLISFITMLYNEKFLDFQLGAFKWKYDIEEVKAGTGSTDNVADLVKARMVSLDKDSLLAAKLAGCLGARSAAGFDHIHCCQSSQRRVSANYPRRKRASCEAEPHGGAARGKNVRSGNGKRVCRHRD